MSKRVNGGAAWLGLAGYVATYDYFAIKTGRETLSSAFGKSIGNAWTRPIVIVVLLGLVKHLVFPHWLPQLDPLAYTANKWREDVK